MMVCYITRIDPKEEKYIRTCEIFENNTNSFLDLRISELVKWVKEGRARLINADINGDDIILHSWPNKCTRANKVGKIANYILIGSIDKDIHKVVTYYKSVIYKNDSILKTSIESNDIGNCIFDGINYLSQDTLNIRRGSKFKQYIEDEYKQFVAKCIMLGKDITFKYTIENKDVKLTLYTGKCRDVVLPNFITSICKDAFDYSGLSSIKLNEGLKFIGARAFEDCGLQSITLPSTVEFAMVSAFLEETQKTLNSDTINVELLNKKTLMI